MTTATRGSGQDRVLRPFVDARPAEGHVAGFLTLAVLVGRAHAGRTATAVTAAPVGAGEVTT